MRSLSLRLPGGAAAPVSPDLRRLARSLGRPALSEGLLTQALTHRSAGGDNNERLEFLGDALLGFVIAQALWERFPAADEGQLSRMRATLVKQESLAHVARGLSLGEYLRLGAGELRTGGHARDSILADAVEALLAAVYLDQGFDAARGVILGVFGPSLDALASGAWGKDPKTRLQELLQSRGRPLPEYHGHRDRRHAARPGLPGALRPPRRRHRRPWATGPAGDGRNNRPQRLC